MRIGIYDPYLDTLGGGENYILTFASCLASQHEVFLLWDDIDILEKAKKRFPLDLTGITTLPNIFKQSFFDRRRAMRQYDVILFVSDGSIPFLTAKKNILLFQYPVNWVNGRSIKNILKLKNINTILCYSIFVKSFLEKTFPKKAVVLPPSIKPIGFEPKKKEQMILTVGRFTRAMNTKKQEMLIDAFKTGYEKHFKNWQLVIIGSVLEQDTDYVEELRAATTGYPITILTNTSYDTLMAHYTKAKIYWHAAGFGEDLTKHPERAEHFGISTVEAMSAGAVPVVINAGGQKEIVVDSEDGYLWDTRAELIAKTDLLVQDKDRWQHMAEKAVVKAEHYNLETFCQKVRSIVTS